MIKLFTVAGADADLPSLVLQVQTIQEILQLLAQQVQGSASAVQGNTTTLQAHTAALQANTAAITDLRLSMLAMQANHRVYKHNEAASKGQR